MPKPKHKESPDKPPDKLPKPPDIQPTEPKDDDKTTGIVDQKKELRLEALSRGRQKMKEVREQAQKEKEAETARIAALPEAERAAAQLLFDQEQQKVKEARAKQTAQARASRARNASAGSTGTTETTSGGENRKRRTPPSTVEPTPNCPECAKEGITKSTSDCKDHIPLQFGISEDQLISDDEDSGRIRPRTRKTLSLQRHWQPHRPECRSS